MLNQPQRSPAFIGYTPDDGSARKDGYWLNVDVADGTTHTNSQTETAIASATIEGGMLWDGAVIEFDAIVEVPDQNTTDTLTLVVYYGGTTLTTAIASSTAHDVADGDVWHCKGRIVVRDADSSGTYIAWVEAGDTPVASGAAIANDIHVTQTASVDFTADTLLEIGADWSVAHADNQVNTVTFNVRVH